MLSSKIIIKFDLNLNLAHFIFFSLIFMFHATYLHHYPSGLASPSWSYRNFIIKHDPCLICTFVGTLNTLTQWHCNIPRGTQCHFPNLNTHSLTSCDIFHGSHPTIISTLKFRHLILWHIMGRNNIHELISIWII
jgi:hypothetical protein